MRYLHVELWILHIVLTHISILSNNWKIGTQNPSPIWINGTFFFATVNRVRCTCPSVGVGQSISIVNDQRQRRQRKLNMYGMAWMYGEGKFCMKKTCRLNEEDNENRTCCTNALDKYFMNRKAKISRKFEWTYHVHLVWEMSYAQNAIAKNVAHTRYDTEPARCYLQSPNSRWNGRKKNPRQHYPKSEFSFFRLHRSITGSLHARTENSILRAATRTL